MFRLENNLRRVYLHTLLIYFSSTVTLDSLDPRYHKYSNLDFFLIDAQNYFFSS